MLEYWNSELADSLSQGLEGEAVPSRKWWCSFTRLAAVSPSKISFQHSSIPTFQLTL